jgi:alpha-L-fucosidase
MPRNQTVQVQFDSRNRRIIGCLLDIRQCAWNSSVAISLLWQDDASRSLRGADGHDNDDPNSRPTWSNRSLLLERSMQHELAKGSLMPQYTIDPDGPTWLEHERFGMFIHWGLYSVAARHEWVKKHENLTDAEYQTYFDHFDPDLFDPALWADAAWNSGMRYVVATAKHHDGFCLWDSKLTDYHAGNSGAGRDLLTPLLGAFTDRGIRPGAYYSLIDWHHPDFTVDHLHPQANIAARAELNSGRVIERYAEYLHAQVEELLRRFDLDYLFFDFSYPAGKFRFVDAIDGKDRDDWQSEKLLELVRSIHPKILINDRLDLDDGYDVVTPEQYQPSEWPTRDGQRVRWEACQTFSGSWGYHRDETAWKSVDQLIGMLIDTVSKGGNLLLNVGPTGRGELDQRTLDSLGGIGEWMRVHERSIRGCTASTFVAPPDARYTQRGNRLYLHLLTYPYRHVHLPGLAGKVEYAQFLNDGSQIQVNEPDPNKEAYATQPANVGPDTLTLELPVRQPSTAVPVVELFLKHD